MRRTPFLTRTGPFNNTRPWRLTYSYGLADRNPSHLLSTSRESRAEYLIRHQDTIQLNNGSLMHFNGAKDIIYFDAESLFNLWYYVTQHRAAPSNVPIRNLRGLTSIQTLGFHSRKPVDHRIRGLRDLLVPAERVFCNVKRIHLLGERGVYTGGGQPATIMPSWRRRKLNSRLTSALKTIRTTYGSNLRIIGSLNSRRNSERQCLVFAELVPNNGAIRQFLTATPAAPGFGILFGTTII